MIFAPEDAMQFAVVQLCEIRLIGSSDDPI